MSSHLKTGVVISFFLFFGCTNHVTYKLEILNSPVAMVALQKTAPFAYTELQFYAYNIESDFAGYTILEGANKDAAIAGTFVAECPFSKNSNLNIPTKIQVGGASALPGYDCHTTTSLTQPWVSVKSHAGRDCSKYPLDSGCSPYSSPASAQVLPYIDPPAGAQIQFSTSPDNHYIVTLTMGGIIPAGFAGLGLFYSPSKEEAESKASEDGTIVDGECLMAAPLPNAVLLIQIGGTPVGGTNCYISNFYLNAGDTLAVRNFVTSRTKYPWSDFVSITIP